jgi:FemAB-related protein (PEP-CTERM system-associated)
MSISQDQTITCQSRSAEGRNHSALAETVAVEELPAELPDAWDAYILAASDATFFHRIGWMRVVREVYGHQPIYLVARMRDSQRICGVLPMFDVWGPFTGRALISVPYAVSGGAIADDLAIESQLVARAQEKAKRLNVRYLELREDSPGDQLIIRDHYYGFRTTLPKDPEAVLGRYPRKARAEIRKARDQYQLTTRFGPDLLEIFYALYIRSLRRLGSPAHSWRFLKRLLDEFGNDCVVEVVDREGTPVAGVLAFRFRDQILPYYAGIDDRYNQFNISNFLYFALMEQAVRLGLRVFDFGRTRRDNVGGCQFKINQGFDPEPLRYCYYSPQGFEPPDLRPSNAAFSRPQAIWRRLPLPVVGPLGGLISRWLP